MGINILLGWYVARLLKKFMFISENYADLYLTTKAFRIFVSGLYSMDSYHGEPMIQELLERIREVNDEIDQFRDVFQYMLDEELEEELNATQEEIEED
ncbi:uncharacterized protein METZ01_LOCUS360056 [marine metagenome]|uniref:Uncharacterized protein n=1 Tax=marine metagenome TaxID=408172 RepID=A0A382SCB8_9ZZZZ